MDHTPTKLLALKAQLYALLAALGAILIFIVGFIMYQNTPSSEQEQAFCGTENLENPNSENAEFQAGKTLFAANCAVCHNKNMKDMLTGPALAGVEKRWADYPRTDLYRWIRHSQQMIQEGHPRAAALWQKWKPTIMNDFPNLTEEQIEQLLVYIGN